MAPRAPKVAPRRPQEAPRRPQEAPRRPQEAPRGPQEGPRGPQDGPKTAPRRPQDGPRGPQEGGDHRPGLKDRSRIAVSRAMAPGWGIKGGINTPLGLFIIKQTKQTNKQEDHQRISHAVGPKARRIFLKGLTTGKPNFHQTLKNNSPGLGPNGV